MILFLNLNYSFLFCSIYNTESTDTVLLNKIKIYYTRATCTSYVCVCVCVCGISVVFPALPGQSPASDPDIHGSPGFSLCRLQRQFSLLNNTNPISMFVYFQYTYTQLEKIKMMNLSALTALTNICDSWYTFQSQYFLALYIENYSPIVLTSCKCIIYWFSESDLIYSLVYKTLIRWDKSVQMC